MVSINAGAEELSLAQFVAEFQAWTDFQSIRQMDFIYEVGRSDKLKEKTKIYGPSVSSEPRIKSGSSSASRVSSARVDKRMVVGSICTFTSTS